MSTANAHSENKWFSRRHQTNSEHLAANEAYRAKQEDKQQRAQERDAAAKFRTPAEQLTILDQRLGVGEGATKERARLLKFI